MSASANERAEALKAVGSRPQQPPAWCAKYVEYTAFADHGRGEPLDLGPVAIRTYDCWGLVRAVLAEHFGIADLPDYGNAYLAANDGKSVAAAVELGKQDSGWQKVEFLHEQPGDVIMLKLAGRPWHCGIIVADPWFLHITPGAGATLEQWTRPLWLGRIEGFYRRATCKA
jgi:cell wall-associated NlpC family hydrolase